MSYEDNYCDNSPCTAEAARFYLTDKDFIFRLCSSCADAFELGQVNPDAAVESIDDQP